MWNEKNCPVCDAENSIETWKQKLEGNKIHYYFKCNKCKREWH